MSNIITEISKPRVLVASAVHDSKEYILDEFLKKIGQLTYKPLGIYLCDSSRTADYSNKILYKAKEMGINLRVERDVWCSDFRGRMVTAHNKLREAALKGNYDYLLIIDQDVLVEPDIIEKFISHKKKVISGIYVLNMGNDIGMVNCCWKRRKILRGSKLIPQFISDDELNKGLIEWDGGMPTGLLFLHREVLEDTVFRHIGFLQDSVYWEDIRNAGYKIYIDTDLFGDHRPSDWDKLRESDIKELKVHRPGDKIKTEDRFYFTPLTLKKW